MIDNATAMLLKRVPIFSELDSALVDDLTRHSRRRTFRANDTLFHEGDPGQTLYIIITGRVHIQTTNAEGAPVHIAVRGPGEHIGELALLDGGPRMADAVTVEPSDMLMLDRADFVRCIELSPRLALAILASLAQRLREAGAQLERDRGLDVCGRVAVVLLEYMESHGKREHDGIRLPVRLTHQHIADRVGASRESVSRTMARFREWGAVRNEGRAFFITDANKLRRYC